MRYYTNEKILGIDMSLQRKLMVCAGWMFLYLFVGVVTGILTAHIAVLFLNMK